MSIVVEIVGLDESLARVRVISLDKQIEVAISASDPSFDALRRIVRQASYEIGRAIADDQLRAFAAQTRQP
jgi:hypothetical protein